MTDSPTASPDAAPLTDPGPPPPLPGGRPGPWDRFFSWVSGLGVTRSDGWIGGVCAGIAARLGIDPVIVRGVFVVAALFGLPVFLVYAAAWAVLPDLTGRIHLKDALNSRFDPAMVGIGLMLLVGLFPVVPWFFTAVLPFGFLVPGNWFDWSPWGLFPTLIVLAVVGGIIFLIARASSRRAPVPGASPVPDPRMASADPSGPGSPAVTMDDSGVHTPAAADPASGSDLVSPIEAGSAPLAPPATASDAELAAWRAQHDAWKAQDDAWRRQQQDAERAAREQARRERAAAGAAFSAEAAEHRRIRRASNPRTSFGFVVFIVGAALVTGALTSLWLGATQPGEPVLAVAFGLFAAALVVSIAMVIAGAMRRRSGFLAFVAVALLVAGSVTAAAPIARGIVFGGAYVNNIDSHPEEFTQMWGPLTIDLVDTGESNEPIVIDKRDGSTDISVGEGVLLDLSVTGADRVEWVRYNPNDREPDQQGTWKSTSTADGESFVRERIDNRDSESGDRGTSQTVTLDQQSGTVHVTIYEF